MKGMIRNAKGDKKKKNPKDNLRNPKIQRNPKNTKES